MAARYTWQRFSCSIGIAFCLTVFDFLSCALFLLLLCRVWLLTDERMARSAPAQHMLTNLTDSQWPGVLCDLLVSQNPTRDIKFWDNHLHVVSFLWMLTSGKEWKSVPLVECGRSRKERSFLLAQNGKGAIAIEWCAFHTCLDCVRTCLRALCRAGSTLDRLRGLCDVLWAYWVNTGEFLNFALVAHGTRLRLFGLLQLLGNLGLRFAVDSGQLLLSVFACGSQDFFTPNVCRMVAFFFAHPVALSVCTRA